MPKMPTVLTAAAKRAVTVTVCAAAFTFVAAQYSWESSSELPSSSGSDGESAINPNAEPSFESYDIGPYSGGSGDESSAGDNSKKKSAAKQPREKATRGKRTGPSFSSAFSGPQKSCPVCSSVRLKSGQYTDYSGGRIHVCSAACIDRVRRNPTAFAEILTKRGEQLVQP